MLEICREYTTTLRKVAHYLEVMDQPGLPEAERATKAEKIDLWVMRLGELDRIAREQTNAGCMEFVEGMRRLLAPAEES